MFDLEKEIRKWRKTLTGIENLEDSDISELESHLRDEIDQLIEQGFDAETAFRQASERSAAPAALNEEYEKLRLFSNRPPFWHPSRILPSLIWNYMKITLRKLRVQKGFSIINVSGLAIGLAACILILLWVQDEISYDRFHNNANQIFRIITEDQGGNTTFTQAGSPAPLGKAMLDSIPEVLNSVRVQAGWSGWYLHLKDQSYTTECLAAVDPPFFEIFNFPFIKGDPKTALKDKFSIVITEELAYKIFGDEDPMGKTLSLNNADMTITGIIRNPPPNSHLHFSYAFPAEHMRQWRESKLDEWTYAQFATYVLLRKDADINQVNKKMMSLVNQHIPPQYKGKFHLYLQPLKQIHLHSTEINTWMLAYPNKGNITYIYIFSLTAFCILILACVNFMNLSTAQYSTRAREVGMRKVVGARKVDLIRQFLGESFILTFTALLIAVGVAELFLPVFNNLTGKNISLIHSGSWTIFIGLAVMGLVSSLVAGSYPAFFLSSFHPVQVFKEKIGLGTAHGGIMRKVFVILQFTFTIGLIILTTVIYRQLHFMSSKPLGYKTDNIIMFAGHNQYETDYLAAKADLLQNPNVLAVCRGFPPPAGTWGTTNVDWEGKDPNLEVKVAEGYCSPDYLKVFEMKLKDGRFISWDFSGDDQNWVLNETAVAAMGIRDPVGKWFSLNGHKGTIIGILEDFHGESLHNPIAPVAMRMSEGFHMFVKFRTGSIKELLPFLEEKWDNYVSRELPFQYEFMDERIETWYRTEKRIGRIFQYFTYLTLFIASLGLLGLSAFMAEQRTKEIGIRKVLGAKISSILLLMTKGFAKWVLAANIIAWPVAYILARKWLSGFAYRVNLGWQIFIFSAAAALLIAVLTVSYQSLRAATANPVKSLRYE